MTARRPWWPSSRRAPKQTPARAPARPPCRRRWMRRRRSHSRQRRPRAQALALRLCSRTRRHRRSCKLVLLAQTFYEKYWAGHGEHGRAGGSPTWAAGLREAERGWAGRWTKQVSHASVFLSVPEPPGCRLLAGVRRLPVGPGSVLSMVIFIYQSTWFSGCGLHWHHENKRDTVLGRMPGAAAKGQVTCKAQRIVRHNNTHG